MNYYENLEFMSNSMLGWFERSPTYYQHKIQKNAEEEESKSLERGKLLHTYIEDPSSFIVSDVEKPGPKNALFIEEYHRTNGNAEKAKKFADMAESAKIDTILGNQKNKEYLNFLKVADGKMCLTGEQQYKIMKAIKALHGNQTANNLLFNDPLMYESYNELEIYFETILQDKYTIKRKSKLDLTTIDHSKKLIKVTDLKTTSENPYGKFVYLESQTGILSRDYYYTGFFNSFIGYKYYRQAAYYVQAITAKFKDLIEDGYTIEFYFVVVELGNSFDVAVYKVNAPVLKYGYNEIDVLLNKYNQCLINDDFGTNHNVMEIG